MAAVYRGGRSSFDSVRPEKARLLQWRIISRVQEDRLDLGDDLPVYLRFIRDFLPFRILLKLGPVLFRGVTAGVSNQIDQRILRQRRVLRSKVGDVLDAVFLEDAHG